MNWKLFRISKSSPVKSVIPMQMGIHDLMRESMKNQIPDQVEDDSINTAFSSFINKVIIKVTGKYRIWLKDSVIIQFSFPKTWVKNAYNTNIWNPWFDFIDN